MALTRLNHAVLYVSDLGASVAFYRDVFGFEPIEGMDGLRGAAFLRAPESTNDHDLGLFEVGPAAGSPEPRRPGLYHLAWEVDTLTDLEGVGRKLQERGAFVGATNHGTTKSFYGRDPDGLEFEVVWLVPAALIDDAAVAGRSQLRPLDLASEIARYGAETRGGIGVSQQA